MEQALKASPATAPIRAPAKAAVSGPGRARALWIALAGLAVLAVAAGLWWSFGRPAPVRYQTAAASTGPVTRSIVSTGMVNPQLTVLVGAYVSGTIQDVFCDYNTRVRRGQVCARIDPRPYQSVVDQDAAALETARAQLVKDQAALDFAAITDRRYRTLLAQDSIARDLVDQAHGALGEALAQVALDRASVAQRAAALEAARINLGYANITSPVDGTVVSRNVTQGQTVAASFQTPTLFLIATDLTRMQVDASVSEGDIGGDLVVGDAATFTVDAYPDHTFKAVVTQIRQAPQTVQNVVTYDVVLTVDNAALLLKPGMTATTRIILARRPQVLRVPNQALRYRPDAAQSHGQRHGAGATGESPRVWVLRDGKPKQVRVSTGLSDDSYTEITGGELRAGDTVITGEAGARTGGAAPAPALRL